MIKNIHCLIILALLILHSPNTPGHVQEKPEDGPVSITFTNLFKEGDISYSPINLSSLEKIPPLPTGFMLFNNMAFRVETKAVWTGAHVFFHLPSINNQKDFDSLRILHLEFDELSPSMASWIDRTVLPDRVREDSPATPKTKEELSKLLPNFSARTITAQVNRHLGLFVIARQDPNYKVPVSPFTKLVMSVYSAPEPVKVENNLTFTINVSNSGQRTPGYIAIMHEMDPDMIFISASSTQGNCRKSDQSDGRVICLLGALPAGAGATIKIAVNVRYNEAWGNDTRDRRQARAFTMLIFKERPADMYTSANMVNAETLTTILTHR